MNIIRRFYAVPKVEKIEGHNLSSAYVKIWIEGTEYYMYVSEARQLGEDIIFAAGEAYGKRVERDEAYIKAKVDKDIKNKEA